MKLRSYWDQSNKFVYESRNFQLAYFHENYVFAFISIRYTFTDLQTLETH